MNRNKLIKKMSQTAIMTALYVVLSIFVNIPLINRIVLELGYVVLGTCSGFMDAWQLMFIGGVGCILKAMLTGGNFPLGWFPAQLLLCFLLSYIGKCQKTYLKVLYCVIICFISIGLVKSFIEIFIYDLPFWAKIGSNSVACLADTIGLLIGVFLSKKFKVE